jgi:peptidoglycan/xylan/chitin deacetylase (PgdA/CDA1 family)
LSRRTVIVLVAAIVTLVLAISFATAGSHADQFAAGTGVPVVPVTPAHPHTSPSPSPSPSPSHIRPAPLSASHSHVASPPAPINITAAVLGMPNAGTLKIPAWPSQGGMHWHGPDDSEGSTGTTSVALTFDDGPGPYTSQILDVLDEFHVKATFCLIGRQISAYQAVVRRMINDGMTLCDHSWDHDEQLGTHTPQYIAANLQRTVDAVHRISAAATMAYFRNPGGNFTPITARVSELLGMRPLYWSVDTDDWKRPGVAAIEKTIETDTHRSSIVLMHDGGGDRSETVAALRAQLPTLKEHFHLIALPTARTVAVNPGHSAP